MSDDLRIYTGLPHHPKMVKLRRRSGVEGCWGLLCLWIWTAENRPIGDLTGMSDEDIEIAAGWEGPAGDLISALVNTKWLDGGSGAYTIHDWKEHQPYVANRPARKAAGKKAAEARWAKDRNAESCEPHQTALPPALPDPPVPNKTSLPAAGVAAVNFPSSEKTSYSEIDFLERDLRKVTEAEKNVERVLDAQPGLGADDVLDMICDRAGVTAIRYMEVKQFQRRRPNGRVKTA